MKRFLRLFSAFTLLLIAVPGCVGDDADEEEPVTLVESLVDRIPVVPLQVPLEEVTGLPAETEYMASYEVPGATDYFYDVESGRLMVTTWNGLVHRVIYQTPLREDLALQEEKNRRFLEEYAGGLGWDENTDREEGILYERSDGEVFAFWNREVDYMTVGTTEFREAGGF